MNADHDFVDKLRKAYQSWNQTSGKSAQDWLNLMDDDVIMKSLADGASEMPFTKARQGKAEAELYLNSVGDDWEMIYFTPEEFIVQGDRVVVLSSIAFKHRQTGKIAKTPKADVFRVRNGLIVEFFEFFDTAGAFAATRFA